MCVYRLWIVSTWHLQCLKTSSLSFRASSRFPQGSCVSGENVTVIHILHSIFRTALLLPSIVRRIDDLLLVKELSATFFEHSIDERLLLIALTTPAAFVDFNYERLEMLGARLSILSIFDADLIT